MFTISGARADRKDQNRADTKGRNQDINGKVLGPLLSKESVEKDLTSSSVSTMSL